jgi:hypothetical protein
MSDKDRQTQTTDRRRIAVHEAVANNKAIVFPRLD